MRSGPRLLIVLQGLVNRLGMAHPDWSRPLSNLTRNRDQLLALKLAEARKFLGHSPLLLLASRKESPVLERHAMTCTVLHPLIEHAVKIDLQTPAISPRCVYPSRNSPLNAQLM